MDKIDVKIQDNFVYNKIKLAANTANGEARFHIGPKSNEADYDAFFDDTYFLFKKDNLLEYLHKTMLIYEYNLFYGHRDVSLSYWQGLLSDIEARDDEIVTSAKIVKNISGSRYYIKVEDHFFKNVFRKLALPLVTEGILHKKDDQNRIFFEIKLKNDIYNDMYKGLYEKYNRILYGAPGTGKSFQLDKEAKYMFKKFQKKVLTKELEDPENINYWVVGARHGEVDKVDDFINNGYWENGYDGKYQDKVNLIKEGDLIGIKSSFTRKIDDEKFISVLRIKALGTVTRNHMDGKKIDVNWVKTEEKDYDGISYRTTIHEVQERHFYIFDRLKSFKTTETQLSIPSLERVTFYDGYTHGQFVGTYKPVPEYEGITYEYTPGPFMRQLVNAYKETTRKFCLIIEEINRARADKVFGNIFQLLDRDDEGDSQYPISISKDQKRYLTEELEENYGDVLTKILTKGLFIPKNLYIWSTMNSADQGVYPLDSAFKRRWHFKHIGLDENEGSFQSDEKTCGITFEIHKNEYVSGISWNSFRHIINEKLLEANVFEDRLIAPFFVKTNNFIRYIGSKYQGNFYELEKDIFMDKVLMYLFDDVLKHKKKSILFDEKYKSFSQLKKGYKETFEIIGEEVNYHSIFAEDIRKKLEEKSIEEDFYLGNEEEVIEEE